MASAAPAPSPIASPTVADPDSPSVVSPILSTADGRDERTGVSSAADGICNAAAIRAGAAVLDGVGVGVFSGVGA